MRIQFYSRPNAVKGFKQNMIQDLGRLSERNSEGLVIACGGKHTAELWNKQGFTLIYIQLSFGINKGLPLFNLPPPPKGELSKHTAASLQRVFKAK
jgi:hypothetical protein